MLRRVLSVLLLLLLAVPAFAADLTQTAANVGVNSSTTIIQAVQCGEAVTQGMPGYLNSSDGKYYQCDNDDTEAKANCTGIFLTPAALDGYSAFALTPGNIDLGATLTVGETYVLSSTKGAIAPIADLGTGDYVTILGVADAADNLVMDIRATGTQKP